MMTNLNRNDMRDKNTVTSILKLRASCDSCFKESSSNSCNKQVGTNGDDLKLTLTHNCLFVLHSFETMPITWRSNTTKTLFGGDEKLS